MLRGEKWQACAVPVIWTEFTANSIEHRVREVTSGERFSVTLFTPSHLERLTERDWMNLESHGFPVHLYPERAGGHQPQRQFPSEAATVVVDLPTFPEVPLASVEDSTVCIEEVMEDEVKGASCVAQKLEKTESTRDAISQLADQIPRPCVDDPSSADLILEKYVLLTREFNAAINLPVGSALRCVTVERGQNCLGNRKGGAKRVARFFFWGGGKRTMECPLQSQFWRPQKVGFVWSVPVSSTENDRA